MHNNRQAFLVLSDKYSHPVLNFFSEINKASMDMGDTLLLFHQKSEVIPKEVLNVNHYTFNDKVLIDLNYTPITNSLIPGSNHFPLLKFFLERNDYEYYWVIEDDVRFSGDWKIFFDFFNQIKADFLSSHVRQFKHEPEWYWWNCLQHPTSFIPMELRLRSFNPIYRVSKEALRFIHTSLIDGWKGHHEILIPTLLKLAGLEIKDFGGDGELSISPNKYYTSETFNWRPTLHSIGNLENKLYHPVKE